MPPSTHYLDLLNLNQVDDSSQQVEFTNEELAKELERFTDTHFLDFEPTFYQPQHEANTFDQQYMSNQQHALGMTDPQKQPTTMTLPRNQRPQFQPMVDPAMPVGSFPAQQGATFEPLPLKRTAETAGLESTDTPISSQADEEDKRRRNTAASARFRIKKKQREQALLESAKQMNDKNTALENRIKELEMENKWLRSLLKPVSSEQPRGISQSHA